MSDCSPGIDPKYLEIIFTLYFKVPGNQNPGYGLGLAISKHFIEAMQGKINASVNPGTGMSFSFSLPVFSS